MFFPVWVSGSIGSLIFFLLENIQAWIVQKPTRINLRKGHAWLIIVLVSVACGKLTRLINGDTVGDLLSGPSGFFYAYILMLITLFFKRKDAANLKIPTGREKSAETVEQEHRAHR